MGIMVYSLSWVMRDLYHQPWQHDLAKHIYILDSLTNFRCFTTRPKGAHDLSSIRYNTRQPGGLVWVRDLGFGA